MQKKKLIVFWVISFYLGLLLVGSVGATQRCVLAELFTSCY